MLTDDTIPFLVSFWQVSVGYFLTDLGMIFWFYPALGGLEYVSAFCFELFVIG